MSQRNITLTLWSLSGAWVLAWLGAYLFVELPKQLRGETLPLDSLFTDYAGVPWAVIGSAIGVALMAVVFVQVGGWLTAWLRVSAIAAPDASERRLHSLEEWALSLTFGAFVVGMLTLAFGLVGVGFPWTALAATVALAWPLWIVAPFALVMAARAALKGRVSGTSQPRPPLPSTIATRGLFCATAALLGFALLYALTPAIQSDGLRYHFAAPQEYLKVGRIVYLPYQAFSNFPFLIEMLFTLALGAGGELLAKGVHWLLLVVSALWVYVIAANVLSHDDLISRRMTRGGMAALAFVATPTVLIVGCWSFIDLGMTAFLLAFVTTLCRWTQTRSRGWLAASALMVGACLGTKYTMLPFAALGAVWVGVMSLVPTSCDPAKPLKVALRRVILFSLIAGAVGAPWYLKNLAWTGNPIYPGAWGMLGGGEWHEDNSALYGTAASGKGFTNAMRGRPVEMAKALVWTPYQTAFRWRDERGYGGGWGGYENHNIGVGYLLMAPFTLGWMAWALWRWRRDPSRALLAVCALTYAGLWFFTYQSNRFLIPLLALHCVMAVDAAGRLRDWRPSGLPSPGRWAWVGLLAATLLNACWATRWIAFDATHPSPLPVAIGAESRDDYLSAALSHYALMSHIDELIEPGERVLFIGEHRGYHCDADYLTSDLYDTPRVLALIRETPDNDALFDRLLDEGVGYVFANDMELNLYVMTNWFRGRFSDNEWERYKTLRVSPRLKRVEAQNDLITLARILPDGNR